jgi:hypothetical protein
VRRMHKTPMGPTGAAMEKPMSKPRKNSSMRMFPFVVRRTLYQAVKKVVWKLNGEKKQSHVYFNQKNRKT